MMGQVETCGEELLILELKAKLNKAWVEVELLRKSWDDQQDAIGDILEFTSDDPNRRGVLPTTLAREVIKLRAEVRQLRAKGIEAFLKLLDERMELAGLGEFWKTHYTDKERLALAEGSISFAVSSVKFNKRWDDNMQRTKRNE